jgi:hypothetical protein
LIEFGMPRIGNSLTAEDFPPLIGVFWIISAADGARLLAASFAMDEAESYGDRLTFGPGHFITRFGNGRANWTQLNVHRSRL